MGKVQNEIKTSEALSGAKKAISETAYLKEQVDHLHLAMQAMWDLLKEKMDLTDKDIRQKMEHLDLSDGKENGRVQSPVIHCQSCGRPISSRRKICLYCGTKSTQGPPI